MVLQPENAKTECATSSTKRPFMEQQDTGNRASDGGFGEAEREVLAQLLPVHVARRGAVRMRGRCLGAGLRPRTGTEKLRWGMQGLGAPLTSSTFFARPSASLRKWFAIQRGGLTGSGRLRETQGCCAPGGMHSHSHPGWRSFFSVQRQSPCGMESFRLAFGALEEPVLAGCSVQKRCVD